MVCLIAVVLENVFIVAQPFKTRAVSAWAENYKLLGNKAYTNVQSTESPTASSYMLTVGQMIELFHSIVIQCLVTLTQALARQCRAN